MKDNDIIKYLRNNQYQKAVKGLYGSLPAVRKYIRANSGTSDEAQDIFQDALVIVYKKVQSPDFKLTVPLSTYLQAVAKNCWWQELRRRKKMPAGEMPAELADMPAAEEPGFQLATTAFNLLGAKCRELLILFYQQQKSFKEIAAQLAFSDERVAKNQKYRCLQKAKDNYLTLSKTGTHE